MVLSIGLRLVFRVPRLSEGSFTFAWYSFCFSLVHNSRPVRQIGAPEPAVEINLNPNEINPRKNYHAVE